MYMVGLQPSMSASIKLFPKQPWAALEVNVDMANHTIVPVFEVPMDIHPDEGLPEEQWQDFGVSITWCLFIKVLRQMHKTQWSRQNQNGKK